MPTLQAVLFLSKGTSGWSEVYPLITAGYTAAKTVMEAGADLRQAMLTDDITIIGFRVSDYTIPGDSLAETLNLPGNYGIVPIPHEKSEPANVAIRIRADTADFLHRGVRYLHAPPDSIITAGFYTPDADFETAMDDYLAWLALNCAIKHQLTPSPGATYENLPIDEAVVDGVWTRNTGRPFGLHRGRRATP